jgi:hypothetical protein
MIGIDFRDEVDDFCFGWGGVDLPLLVEFLYHHPQLTAIQVSTPVFVVSLED